MDLLSWTLNNDGFDQGKPLYIDANDASRWLSANQIREKVRQLISGFNYHGLGAQDCVCVVSFNDIQYTSLYLGIIGSGACFTGANPGYTVSELIHHLRMTDAKFILTEPKALNISIAAAKECQISDNKIFVLNFRNEVVSGYQSWNTLLNFGEKGWVEVEEPLHTPAAYVSTSGTSGLPKAAVIPHSYLVSQAGLVEAVTGMACKASYLIALPPFHVFTIPMQHTLPLRTGNPVYIMPRFEERGFVSAITSFHITQTITVPPILMALSKYSNSELTSLRRVFVGGSCATDGMQKQLYKKLHPDASITQVYGMTEIGWATAWMKSERDITGSVGQALPGTIIRIMGDNESIIGRDEFKGEVQIHTLHAMKGYLHNSLATSEAFTSDGWVRTGDIGYVKEGNWYIIDRTKDLIKVRGWQVSPAEIEAALLEHRDVLDAGIIGVPAKDGCGEAPLAFVVRKEGSDLKEDGVKEFLSGRLARYKNVEEVEFVERIPRNPTGKILRRLLKDSRESKELTSQQEAAKAYVTALQRMDTYEQSRNSYNEDVLLNGTSKNTGLSIVTTAVHDNSIFRAVPRKRKYCPACMVPSWRKLRFPKRDA